MNLQEELDKLGIRHFTAEELLKHETPEELYQNILPTVLVADYLRDSLGFALKVNSAYRSPEYNKTLQGSSKTSLHLIFNALDLSPAPWTAKKASKLIATVQEGNWHIPYKDTIITKEVMGIGLYNIFVHIDTRGLFKRPAPARWDRRHLG